MVAQSHVGWRWGTFPAHGKSHTWNCCSKQKGAVCFNIWNYYFECSSSFPNPTDIASQWHLLCTAKLDPTDSAVVPSTNILPFSSPALPQMSETTRLHSVSPHVPRHGGHGTWRAGKRSSFLHSIFSSCRACVGTGRPRNIFLLGPLKRPDRPAKQLQHWEVQFPHLQGLLKGFRGNEVGIRKRAVREGRKRSFFCRELARVGGAWLWGTNLDLLPTTLSTESEP